MNRQTIPITLRPNAILETGRVSYSDVIQQLPRKGGIRECFVARPGYVYCSCDYGGLELVTHAQHCLWTVGDSKLAEALNAGIKVHDALGATILGILYDDFRARFGAGDKQCKNIRQAAKPANFGFPGGMGEVKLVQQQRKQGPDTIGPDGRKYKGLRFCILLGAQTCGARKVTEWKRKTITPTCLECIEIAANIRSKWFIQWPENKLVFEFINECIERGQPLPDGTRTKPGQIRQHVSHRLRGGLDFKNAANSFFQGLGADGAQAALHQVTRECYDSTYRLPDGSRSPLFGCRPIVFQHDEIFMEMPEAIAHLAAERLSTVMVEVMRSNYTPDVFIEAPPALMRRWLKEAEPVYLTPENQIRKGANKPGDKLIPYDDRENYPMAA